MSQETREAWLLRAAQLMRDTEFKRAEVTVPDCSVSIGFPSGSGRKFKAIGQCWASSSVKDGKPAIFISPVLDDASRIIDVLIHEMVHAAVGHAAGHGKAFKRVALAVGLEGKMTATVASSQLKFRIEDYLKELGPLPHAAVVPGVKAVGAPKKQATRLIKCECSECGYVVRTTRQWLDLYAAPLCPCNPEEPRRMAVVD